VISKKSYIISSDKSQADRQRGGAGRVADSPCREIAQQGFFAELETRFPDTTHAWVIGSQSLSDFIYVYISLDGGTTCFTRISTYHPHEAVP
jgi:hypothetical protein